MKGREANKESSMSAPGVKHGMAMINNPADPLKNKNHKLYRVWNAKNLKQFRFLKNLNKPVNNLNTKPSTLRTKHLDPNKNSMLIWPRTGNKGMAERSTEPAIV